jgi:hypothetical protein
MAMPEKAVDKKKVVRVRVRVRVGVGDWGWS